MMSLNRVDVFTNITMVVNKKILVKKVFVDDVSGDEM
jgi:hypothetical protein